MRQFGSDELGIHKSGSSESDSAPSRYRYAGFDCLACKGSAVDQPPPYGDCAIPANDAVSDPPLVYLERRPQVLFTNIVISKNHAQVPREYLLEYCRRSGSMFPSTTGGISH